MRLTIPLLLLLLTGCEAFFALADPGAQPGEEEEEPTPEFVADSMTVDFEASFGDTNVAIDWDVTYWVDIRADVANCNQRMRSEASVEPRPSSCTSCDQTWVGLEGSVTDQSNPLQFGRDCDPALLDATAMNFGSGLLRPISDNGLSDLLSVAFLDADTHAGLETAIDAQGQFTPDFMQAAAQNLGAVYAGVGLLQLRDGSLASGIQLDVAANALASGEWRPFFVVFRDPEVNDWDGDGLRGEYFGQGVFSVGFAR